MQKTRNILMSILWGMLAAAAVIIIVYETSLALPGTLADNKQAEFVSAVVMELVALGSIPLALWLFKWKYIASELITHKEKALLKWGALRMLMLSVPVIANLMLYYLFLNPTFAYLALIHAICLMFVWPTMDRCVAETSQPT